MFTCNISLVTLVRGVGGKLSRLVYLAPRLGFVSGSVISQFLLHHNLGISSCKRYKHYFSQTEMFTSNVQFGYPCLRAGGQAVQAGLSCPPPTKDLGRTVSSVHSYCTIILEYLVAIIVEHYCLRGRGKLSRLVYLAPPRLGFESNNVIS